MKGRNKSWIILIPMFVLLIAVLSYLFTRLSFLYISQLTPFEHVFSLLYFFAEAFILFHCFFFFLSVASDSMYHDEPKQTEPGRDASVAILIPARHEPKEIIENTLLTCKNIEYEQKKVYLLDDSSLDKFKQEARELSAVLGVEVFTRDNNRGAKAGMINEVLKTLTEKYIAIFDADQNPMPLFLSKIIPLLEGNDKLAFVQTQQFYSNGDFSPVALASQAQQAVFFEYVCQGKSAHDAMFCCGTNVVFRRSALEDVGGFAEDSVTEDLATSVKMHRKHWKSLYCNKAYTFGMAPEDLESYFKQQSRWAMGSIGLFRRIVHLFFSDMKVMTSIQWIEYTLATTWYFIGWAYFFMVAGPVMYIFFNVHSFLMDPWLIVLTWVPYFFLSMVMFYSSMLKKKYPLATMFKVQVLNMLTIPILMKAAIFGILNIKKGFQVTPKGVGRSVPYIGLWQQLLLLGVNLAAMGFGVFRLSNENDILLSVDVFWVFFHSILFAGIFYFNKK